MILEECNSIKIYIFASLYKLLKDETFRLIGSDVVVPMLLVRAELQHVQWDGHGFMLSCHQFL
jgi:hypothetical protein